MHILLGFINTIWISKSIKIYKPITPPKTPSVASSDTPMKAAIGFVLTLDVYLVVYLAANVETPSFL